MLCLGIETSCDETAAAVVAGGRRVLANVVASQVDLHRRYGGVVPEVASRCHVEAVLPVIESALGQAGVRPEGLAAIAVTRGPGLVGALLVGVAAAKALALAWGLPLIGVNHLEGHIYANFLADTDPEWPLVCLIASGGHADLLYMAGPGQIEILGRTRDDAAGEAFDKVARAMGLGYPGGPEIARLAGNGDPTAFDLPRAFLEEGSLDFSFSGLKTAVIYLLEDCRRRGKEPDPADLAASFQQAVVDVLVEKTFLAAQERRVNQVLLAGGVAANWQLRVAFQSRAADLGLNFRVPPPEMCTDNAAMIAAAGWHAFQRGRRDGLDLDVEPRLSLTTVST